MFEGQTIICQKIVEDNWLEFLGYVKRQSDEEMERQLKRMEALKEFEQPAGIGSPYAEKATVAAYPSEHRYYDLNLSSFWSWYITNKLEDK